MGYLLAFAFVFNVLYFLLLHYSQYLFGAVAVIGIIWFAYYLNQKIKIAAQEAEAKRQREKDKIAEREAAQQNLKTKLVRLTDTSLQTFEALPGHLLQAESLLDQAEQDFKEGAFAPFWDSIEQATLRLGNFNGSIASINHNLEEHGELSKLYDKKPPRFPIGIDSVKGMVAGNTTADRLKTIVREAQRNFQFASIYEQRKTNQILIAGFTNLAQALDGMGRRISESINELSTQVSEMSSSMNLSMATIGEQIATVNQSVSESVQELHSTFQKESKDQARRHDRALEMLDNIQRRRMPADVYLGTNTTPAP